MNRDWRERMTMRLAWMLPRYLVMWCAYRVMAHASQGQWGNETPDSIDMMTMIDRWSKP